jgi:hypothetical protein
LKGREMIQELLKNKKVAITAFIFIILSIIVIVLAIFNNFNKQSLEKSPAPETSYDKATGETITTFSGYKAEDVMYAGFDILLDSGVSSSQLHDLKSQLKEYGKTILPNLERISYYKNSYVKIENSKPVSYSLKFALDNDKKDIFTKIVIKGIENYEIHLYEDSNFEKEVKSYSFCSAAICPPAVNPDNTSNIQ